MWLFSLLPIAWEFYFTWGVIILGGIGYLVSEFASFIPPVTLYAFPIRIASIALLVCGVFLYGVSSSNEFYKKKLATYHAEVLDHQDKYKKLVVKADAAQKASDLELVELRGTIAKQAATISNLSKDLHLEIGKHAFEMDSACKVPLSAITIMNNAAKNPARGIR